MRYNPAIKLALLSIWISSFATPTMALVWNEAGNAGQLLGSAQVTYGAGALTEVTGNLSDPNDVDLYAITINDPAGFSASMDWPEGATEFVDAAMFLFDDGGIGVAFNDDTVGPDFRPEFPLGSAVGPSGPGTYYLGIAVYSNMPLSSGGGIFTASRDLPTGPDGPGGASPLIDWTAGVASSVGTVGPYSITLTGTSAATVNPPFDADNDGVRDDSDLCPATAEAQFGDLILSEIMSVDLSSDPIDGSDNADNMLLSGAILVYVTDAGRYGKMQITNYGYDLHFRCVTYDQDGAVFLQKNDAVVTGTWPFDLDRGEMGSVLDSPSDFWWRQDTSVERFLAPVAGALFAKAGKVVDENGCSITQRDTDNDGISDLADNCRLVSNPNQANHDSDGSGDLCDDDDDNDGILDGADNCPLVANLAQADNDDDGSGNICDDDDDNDKIPDAWEIAHNLDPLVDDAAKDVDNDGIYNLKEYLIWELIAKYYNDIIDRDPDPAELAAWQAEIERIISLEIDIKEGFIALAKFFFNSDEYLSQGKSNGPYVTDLYQTFFSRPPDSAGSAYWVDQLTQGSERNVILNYFVYSPEFNLFMIDKLGNDPSNPGNDLINDHYRGLLNRLPESAGFSGWLAMLRQAQCGGAEAIRNLSSQITSGFLQGPEYELRNRTDTEFLEDLYNGILRRGATSEEFQGWIDIMNSGMSRIEVLENFVNSAEFQLRVEAIIASIPTDQDCDGDGWTIDAGDCDDNNFAVHPGATEVCGNGVDEDCDGGDLSCTGAATWYKDADGDGYSDGTSTTSASRPGGIYFLPTELSAVSGDCNDNAADIHPGTRERCHDGVDNDCDGRTDDRDDECRSHDPI
ncbi:MAG: DVUA0089 family protein [Desulfobacterales bacterium]|nr:MAG: DVUA0089 family protein [Desulfobacterales bacterium]